MLFFLVGRGSVWSLLELLPFLPEFYLTLVLPPPSMFFSIVRLRSPAIMGNIWPAHLGWSVSMRSSRQFSRQTQCCLGWTRTRRLLHAQRPSVKTELPMMTMLVVISAMRSRTPIKFARVLFGVLFHYETHKITNLLNRLLPAP